METAQLEPNIFWVAWSVLSFVFAVGFLWAVVWIVRRLQSISALERRVNELERRPADQELVKPSSSES